MSRFLAFILTLAALGAGGWMGKALWETRQTALVPPPNIEIARAGSGEDTRSETRRSRGWPALFGELAPPAPAQEDTPEPQPPAPEPEAAPPSPPLESQGYGLSGIIRSGDKRWAIVTHPTGDNILKPGDELIDGAIVVEITAEEIVVETGRGRETLALSRD